MTRVLTSDDVRSLVRKMTLKRFFMRFAAYLEKEASRRSAVQFLESRFIHNPSGTVVAWWAAHDADYGMCQWTTQVASDPQKQGVVGFGALIDCITGHPLCLSEMTFLTPLCEATVSALAAQRLSNPSSDRVGVWGVDAYSLFRVAALHFLLGVKTVSYCDIAPEQVAPWAQRAAHWRWQLLPCDAVPEVLAQSDVMVCSALQSLIPIRSGVHVDVCAGSSLLREASTASFSVRHVQHLSNAAAAERVSLWALLSGAAHGRQSAQDVTVFHRAPSTVENHSLLRFMYQMAEEYHVGHHVDLVPGGCADLFSLLVG